MTAPPGNGVVQPAVEIEARLPADSGQTRGVGKQYRWLVCRKRAGINADEVGATGLCANHLDNALEFRTDTRPDIDRPLKVALEQCDKSVGNIRNMQIIPHQAARLHVASSPRRSDEITEAIKRWGAAWTIEGKYPSPALESPTVRTRQRALSARHACRYRKEWWEQAVYLTPYNGHDSNHIRHRYLP